MCVSVCRCVCVCFQYVYFSAHCYAATQDSAVLTKQQASVLIDGITNAVDKRCGLCTEYQEAIATYKSSKDSKGFNNKRKALGDKYQAFTEEVASRAKDLHALDAEASAKVRQLWFWAAMRISLGHCRCSVIVCGLCACVQRKTVGKQ